MEDDKLAQLKQLNMSLNKVAAATLAGALLAGMGRKPTLKDIQMAFNDCYKIVNPDSSVEQEDFQKRLDKKEW